MRRARQPTRNQMRTGNWKPAKFRQRETGSSASARPTGNQGQGDVKLRCRLRCEGREGRKPSKNARGMVTPSWPLQTKGRRACHQCHLLISQTEVPPLYNPKKEANGSDTKTLINNHSWPWLLSNIPFLLPLSPISSMGLQNRALYFFSKFTSSSDRFSGGKRTAGYNVLKTPPRKVAVVPECRELDRRRGHNRRAKNKVWFFFSCVCSLSPSTHLPKRD